MSKGNPELDLKINRHHNMPQRRYRAEVEAFLSLQEIETDGTVYCQAQIAHTLGKIPKTMKHQIRTTKALIE